MKGWHVLFQRVISLRFSLRRYTSAIETLVSAFGQRKMRSAVDDTPAQPPHRRQM